MILKRVSLPGEVAVCVLFLASDEASFITGATLEIDGVSQSPGLTSSGRAVENDER